MSAPEWVPDQSRGANGPGEWLVLWGPHRLEVRVRSWASENDVPARELAERIAGLGP